MKLYSMAPGVNSGMLSLRAFALVCPLLACLLLLPAGLCAQSAPPLERTVSISFQQERTGDALARLSKAGKFTFSYSPAVIDTDRTVTAAFRNSTVREVLIRLFGQEVRFRERGNYIILTHAPVPQSQRSTEVVITGYVQNEDTGIKIPAVSVYDKNTLSAAVSDRYGFFELKIDKPSARNHISVNKIDYKDTVVTVDPSAGDLLVISLRPKKKYDADLLTKTRAMPDTLSDIRRDAAEWKTTLKPVANEYRKPQQINMQNIRDTLYRKYQVSFVPFAGSNHILSGNVVNDRSFNVIGGYSLGTRELEIGGVFNVDRGNVSSFQYAGVFNSTLGGDVSGMQMAGVINTNLSRMEGGQFAGVVNVNGRESRGAQLAGVLNVQFQGFHGYQFAGVMNVNTGLSTGAQFSGVLNVQVRGFQGPQFAGIMNVNGGASGGAQFAGVVNMQLKDYKGTQVAGVANIATHKVSGSQLAGVVNFGREVRGIQFGILNIADTVHSVPIGMLSFVRKGYHTVELSADEVFYANLAFRTGVRSFYNILMAGIKPGTFSDPFWSVGYGVGTLPRLTRDFYLNVDVTSQHVSKGHLMRELSLLNKVYVGVQFPLAKKLAMTAGVTLNAYITDPDVEYPDLFTDYTPHVTREQDESSLVQLWWGGKIGLRFTGRE